MKFAASDSGPGFPVLLVQSAEQIRLAWKRAIGDRNDAVCSAILSFLDKIHGKELAL